VPVVISTLAVTPTTGRAYDLGFGASPSWGIAPSRPSVGLALLQRYSLRSSTHDRPHVSVSEAVRSALASCGILSDTPYGWHLLTSYESTCRLTPFPMAIARILRACSPPGFCGSAGRSVLTAAGALSCAVLAPAYQPLTLGKSDDGSSTPSLALPIDACETGYPA
jgi:hypothetical protein